MRTIYITLNFLILFIFLAACDSDKCFYGAGNEITSLLNSDSFRCIAVRGIFDVELVQDTCYYVEGTGGKNLLENVDASVKQDTLLLYNYNGCSWLREYKRPLLRVHFSDIDRVDVFQASYIFSKDSITDELYFTLQTMMAEADIVVNNNSVSTYVHHTSSGRYIFRGKTNRLSIVGFYNSLYDASELEAKKVEIQNYSIIDYKVWATEQLNVSIYNRGNVYYKGNPEVIIDTVASTGKILKLE